MYRTLARSIIKYSSLRWGSRAESGFFRDCNAKVEDCKHFVPPLSSLAVEVFDPRSNRSHTKRIHEFLKCASRTARRGNCLECLSRAKSHLSRSRPRGFEGIQIGRASW